MLTPAQQAAIPIMAAAAVASEIATRDNGNPGLPAELTMAQCIFECDWLQKAPGFNAFGIKAYPGCFGIQILPTTEWMTPAERDVFVAHDSRRTATLSLGSVADHNGRFKYNCTDAFATFAALADCFAYHGRLITKSRSYAKAWQKYCVGMQSATSPADKQWLVNDLIQNIAPTYAPGNSSYAQLIGGTARGETVTNAIQQARSTAA